MKWKTLETEQIFKTGIVSVDKEKCEMPDGRIMPGYYIFHFPDWVNIVPITKDKKIVLIKQYRHATGLVHWEVPGGAAHRNEDPLMAARRELEEETGFCSEKIIKVAANYPNPALQDNMVHTYLALDCEYKGPQNLDPYEEIQVETLALDEAERWLQEGKFTHNICVASLFQSISYLRNHNMI